MEELLRALNKKYNLKLGSKLFSPVMQCSVGLAMHYNELVKKGLTVPFHLNFPDKHNAALWLSVVLLRNFFLEDYINQAESRLDELDLKKGDIIKIFGANAQFIARGEKQFQVKFKNPGNFYLSNSLSQYVNKSKGRINKFALYARKKKKSLKHRNAISKLLEPKEEIFIDPGILTSKVLVIAGRGNTGTFANWLKEEFLFDTPLSDVFNSGENIFIKPDLEDYTFLSETDDSDKADYFKKIFLRYKEELLSAVPDRTKEINNLIEMVENSVYRSHKFLKLYEDLLEEIDDDSTLHRVKDYFPGVKDTLPKDLKSVVINDIVQVKNYEGILKEILNRKIPILIISNRYIDDTNALHFFDEYFRSRPDELRINWNKSKIKALQEVQGSSFGVLDEKLWGKCLKFSDQKISISTTEKHPCDSLIIKIQRNILRLEGQERLKKNYWQVFNPLIYSYKNGTGWKPYHENLIEKFLDVYDKVKVTLDKSIRTLFENLLESIQRQKSNFKNIQNAGNIFVQSIEVDGLRFRFPEINEETSTISNINSKAKMVTFPGYPLNEPLNNSLLKSVSEYLIKNIKLICWPREGEFTFNYIRRRLKTGYFTDNIPSDWGLDSNLLIKSEQDIDKEINSTLVSDLIMEVSEDDYSEDELVLENISKLKYNSYQGSESAFSNSMVSCNIIDLEGNAFMFLPKNSTVLAKVETEGEEFVFRKAKFNELHVGDEIFQYELSRHQLRELSKSVKGSDAVFNDLDVWKKSLQATFDRCNRNLNELLSILREINRQHEIGGNPTYQNLRNWLYDEDMLSPEEKNLRMILLADSDKSKIQKLGKILSAYKTASSLSRKVSSEIKKAIIKKLSRLSITSEKKFAVEVYGIRLIVEFRKIVGLQKTDIEIEYQNTRKIIS